MKQKEKKVWVPKEDFRTRFAQRDLEISIAEYNYIRDQYLESQRKKKEQQEKIRKELEEQEAREKETKKQKQKEAEDTLKATEYPGTSVKKQTQKNTDQKQQYEEVRIPTIQELAESGKLDELKENL